MRYLLAVCCLMVAGCGSRDADDPWQTIELGTDAEFRDIFFLDAQNGWMVGGVGVSVPGGIVARTRDGGLTWQYRTQVIAKRYRATSVDLNAVYFLDESRGIGAAESGTIIRTEDGGESWQKVKPTGPVYAHHRDIDFVDDLNGWIIGDMGVLGTEDGGGSWARIDEDLETAGEALDMLDLNRGWMVGKFGLVLRTDDGGFHWEVVPALGDLSGLSGDEKPHLRAVHFVDQDHGWAAGFWREFSGFEQYDWAVIIHTADGGRTWQRQIEGVESHLTAIRFLDRERGWATGYNRNDGTSLILATTDGGASWQQEKTIHGEELRDLEIRAGHVWVAGDRVRQEKQKLLRLVLPVAGSGLLEGIDESE